MKKTLILFLTAIQALSAGITRLPEEFTIAERFFSLTPFFDVCTETERFATARKRFFSTTATFDLEDRQGESLATASARFFSWGTIADVKDAKNQKIGWIEEEIFRIFPWAEYRVFNAANQLAAIAKMNFWGTEFELFHPDLPNLIYAKISRPFCHCFSDRWSVKILNYEIFESGLLDPRLLVVLAIFQSDKDARERIRKQLSIELLEDFLE